MGSSYLNFPETQSPPCPGCLQGQSRPSARHYELPIRCIASSSCCMIAGSVTETEFQRLKHDWVNKPSKSPCKSWSPFLTEVSSLNPYASP